MFVGVALELLKSAIEKAGYPDKIIIGMDVAASEFYRSGKYDLDFKSPDDPSRHISGEKLGDLYRSFIKNYPGTHIHQMKDNSPKPPPHLHLGLAAFRLEEGSRWDSRPALANGACLNYSFTLSQTETQNSAVPRPSGWGQPPGAPSHLLNHTPVILLREAELHLNQDANEC